MACATPTQNKSRRTSCRLLSCSQANGPSLLNRHLGSTVLTSTIRQTSTSIQPQTLLLKTLTPGWPLLEVTSSLKMRMYRSQLWWARSNPHQLSSSTSTYVTVTLVERPPTRDLSVRWIPVDIVRKLDIGRKIAHSFRKYKRVKPARQTLEKCQEMLPSDNILVPYSWHGETYFFLVKGISWWRLPETSKKPANSQGRQRLRLRKSRTMVPTTFSSLRKAPEDKQVCLYKIQAFETTIPLY